MLLFGPLMPSPAAQMRWRSPLHRLLGLRVTLRPAHAILLLGTQVLLKRIGPLGVVVQNIFSERAFSLLCCDTYARPSETLGRRRKRVTLLITALAKPTWPIAAAGHVCSLVTDMENVGA